MDNKKLPSIQKIITQKVTKNILASFKSEPKSTLEQARQQIENNKHKP